MPIVAWFTALPFIGGNPAIGGGRPKNISIDANRHQRTVYPHDAALNAELQRALIA